MSFAFSGPSFTGLFPALGGAVIVGALYKSLAKTNSRPILVLAVRAVADFALYHFVALLSNAKMPQTKAKIYAATTLCVNFLTLAYLRQKELVGNIGTALFIALMIIEGACKWADFPKYRQ